MDLFATRRSGLSVPLFSLRSESDWGIGEFPMLGTLAKWAAKGGFSAIQTLPLLEPAPGQESPYSACSFFALDPAYISLPHVDEFRELGGTSCLDAEERAMLQTARRSPRVNHDVARQLKHRVLVRCFAQFRTKPDSDPRRVAFQAFVEEENHWISNYALFRVLKSEDGRSYLEWAESLRSPNEEQKKELAGQRRMAVEERMYEQWIAFEQLRNAKLTANAEGVFLGGDEPFLVATDSADVWGQPHRYRFDATVGAPPDPFSADGQEWGLPPYNWDRIREENYALFSERGKHASRLYDFTRIDHVVGLYRTYVRPLDKSPAYFVPNEENAQKEQGEASLLAFAKHGISLLAEDLGVIPDFVRESMLALKLPGFRVMRWEQRDGHFLPLNSYPERSVATTGTHDTESMWEWFERLPDWEREALRGLSGLSSLTRANFDEDVWQNVMRELYRSSSCMALIPLWDFVALPHRVNIPGTLGPWNWSVRLPWTLDAMQSDPVLEGRLADARSWAEQSSRS